MANRKNTFLLKRSNVAGKKPSAGDLLLGELAINTADGILYTSGTTANSILPIGWDRVAKTGDTMTGGLFTPYLSATTISATTYVNLPSMAGSYLPLSGGTVYGPTSYTGGLTANTLNVTGLTQTSGITSTGGITFKQVTINSSYTATTSDYMIDITGGTFSVTLPSAVGIQGRLLVIKNNGGGAVTVQPILGQNIDDKLFVILGETNSIQLVSNGSNWVALGYNISTVNSSTGVFEFTGLTKLTSSTFRVAPVKGWIVDDTTNPLSPQLLYVTYTGGTHTATYVNTATETWVYLTSGGTISQSNILLTDQQRRQNIFLGKLGHADKTTIINAFSQPDFVLSPLSQLRDMFDPIGLINESIRPSANGVNLSFNTSAGYLHGLGINFSNDTLNPNAIYVSGTAPCTFQYRTQTGGTASNVTVIDPTKYDVGGVVTSVSGTKATNQRIYLVQNGLFRVQYGQTVYSTLPQAIAGLSSEPFIEFSNFTNNGILIGILSVLSSATDLSDINKAQFFNVSKFGDSAGASGGAATTTLQQAYNNSTSPEIVTNSTLNALSIKNGTGNADNTTNLLEGLNTAGNTTSFIRADGDISGTTLQTNGFTGNSTGMSATTVSATTIKTPSFTANNGGITATTVSATTYFNLPTDVRVTGGTYSNGSTTFTNNTGGTFSVTGYYTGSTDIYTTGLTFNAGTYDLKATRNDGVTLTANLAILASDMTVTGGTYNPSTGIATFTNNTGGTFSVTGFLTGMTDTYTTGFTYSNNTLTIKRNVNQPDLSVLINTMTGLTISGTLNTTSISATTYQNLPSYIITPISVVSGSSLFSTGLSNTGTNASGVTNSIFFGGGAGYQATNAANSNFIGYNSGYQASAATNSNFIGFGAGSEATGADLSNFIGYGAGRLASVANQSVFVGYNAGSGATSANTAVFIGLNAGLGANGANRGVFIGGNAGRDATGAYESAFIGLNAGWLATNAYDSVFLGLQSGYSAVSANTSNFIGYNAGYSATTSYQSNFIGLNAGYKSTSAYTSNFIGRNAGREAETAYQANFMGFGAGYFATNANISNFIGYNAGYSATGASASNFIGINTGYNAINAIFSNFIGYNTGYNSTGATQSNFIGFQAGYNATNANTSNFIGYNAGYNATNGLSSNFMGFAAGFNATNASLSNLIGWYTGFNATGASYSNLFGYNVGYALSASNSIGNNNIIIGTNITLPAATTNAINIGGVLFGTNTYSTVINDPFSGVTSNGRIGIGIINPSTTLHVSGNTTLEGSLNITGSTSSELVKIIQNGSGDAFVVEDQANGDASHFVINASGNTAIGLTAPIGNDKLTVSGNTTVYGALSATTVSGDGSGLTNLPIPYGLITAISSGNYLI